MFVTDKEDNLPDGLFKTNSTDPVFPVNLVIFKSTDIISTSVYCQLLEINLDHLLNYKINQTQNQSFR